MMRKFQHKETIIIKRMCLCEKIKYIFHILVLNDSLFLIIIVQICVQCKQQWHQRIEQRYSQKTIFNMKIAQKELRQKLTYLSRTELRAISNRFFPQDYTAKARTSQLTTSHNQFHNVHEGLQQQHQHMAMEHFRVQSLFCKERIIFTSTLSCLINGTAAVTFCQLTIHNFTFHYLDILSVTCTRITQ